MSGDSSLTKEEKKNLRSFLRKEEKKFCFARKKSAIFFGQSKISSLLFLICEAQLRQRKAHAWALMQRIKHRDCQAVGDFPHDRAQIRLIQLTDGILIGQKRAQNRVHQLSFDQ